MRLTRLVLRGGWIVGQTPWSAADALVGLVGVNIKFAAAGPGGPWQTRGAAPPSLADLDRRLARLRGLVL